MLTYFPSLLCQQVLAPAVSAQIAQGNRKFDPSQPFTIKWAPLPSGIDSALLGTVALVKSGIKPAAQLQTLTDKEMKAESEKKIASREVTNRFQLVNPVYEEGTASALVTKKEKICGKLQAYWGKSAGVDSRRMVECLQVENSQTNRMPKLILGADCDGSDAILFCISESESTNPAGGSETTFEIVSETIPRQGFLLQTALDQIWGRGSNNIREKDILPPRLWGPRS